MAISRDEKGRPFVHVEKDILGVMADGFIAAINLGKRAVRIAMNIPEQGQETPPDVQPPSGQDS